MYKHSTEQKKQIFCHLSAKKNTFLNFDFGLTMLL